MNGRPPSTTPPADADEPPWPDDAVEVGRVLGAWGIKGWIKVAALASDPQALFSSKRWFLAPPEVELGRRRPAEAWTAPRLLRVSQAKEHGDGIVAGIHDIDGRDAAERLKGGRLFVSRANFPSTDDDEFYWVDLIGLEVLNREGMCLGTVVGLLDTGPHSVLRIAQPSATKAADECLIPFVASFIDRVDLPTRRIVVDWQADY